MTLSGSEIYAAFIEASLKAESDRRESVNTRAASAGTSATGLITLALAVFGLLVSKNQGFPGCAKPLLLLALAFLLAAGACAVAAGFPWRQHLISTKTLNRMLNSHRDDSEAIARDAVAYCNAVTLVSVSSGTTTKVRFLLASGICQILAIAAVGGCIWVVATDHSGHHDVPAVKVSKVP